MLLKIAILFAPFLLLIQIGHAAAALELDNPLIVIEPYTGRTALNWNIRKQPNGEGRPMPEGKYFIFNMSNNSNANRLQLPMNATKCPTIGLMNLKGHCLEIADSNVPDSIEISIVFENGNETNLGQISFDKWHNKITKPHGHGNKTIEEMFHAVQSEIGQLRKHIDQLDLDDHAEEKTTRMMNGAASILEVFLIWIGPFLAAIGAVIAAKLGLKNAETAANIAQNGIEQRRVENDDEEANLIGSIADGHQGENEREENLNLFSH